MDNKQCEHDQLSAYNPDKMIIISEDVFNEMLRASANHLTKREHFAAMAMKGILANSLWAERGDHLTSVVAQSAVTYADALLAELEKAND